MKNSGFTDFVFKGTYYYANMVANILGLGAAATPMGLLAFKEMAKECVDSKPTRSMLTFIAINCSSLTLIPTTIISLRKLNGGNTNINVILMMIIATSISTFVAIVLDRIFYKLDQRKNKK